MSESNVAVLARSEPAPNYTGLTMVVSPAEALRRVQQLQAFVAEVMVSGTDYGIIPGTEKPTLLQPGAQKLCEIYGFAFAFQDSEKIEDWDKPLFHYEVKCVLTSRRDGSFIGEGMGSCNSRESRYAGRWAFESDIPQGVDKKTLKRRVRNSRKGGKPYTQFWVANEDIFTLVNTIRKMACKRALVHAVVGATRSAGIFTQDVEDIPGEAFGRPEADEPPPRDIEAEQREAEARRKALFESVLAAITSSHSLEQLGEARKQIVRARHDKTLTPEQLRLLIDEGSARKATIEQMSNEHPDPHANVDLEGDIDA